MTPVAGAVATVSPGPLAETLRPAFDIADLVVRRGEGSGGFLLGIRRLTLDQGDRVALVGPSGSGKTSLLDVLAFMAAPESVATFRFGPAGGRDIAAALGGGDSNALARLRRHHIGYVPQVGGLLPALTVRDNVALPRRLLGLADDGTVDRLLDHLGLARHAAKRPEALSVGERQRVAIGRALAHRPAVICADEPTAALDPYNSDRIMDLFVSLAGEVGSTLVVVSHEQERVTRFGLRLLRHEVRPQPDGSTLATVRQED